MSVYYYLMIDKISKWNNEPLDKIFWTWEIVEIWKEDLIDILSRSLSVFLSEISVRLLPECFQFFIIFIKA